MREIFIKIVILRGKAVKDDHRIRSCIGEAFSGGVPHFKELSEVASPSSVLLLTDCAASSKGVTEPVSIIFTLKNLCAADLGV